MKKVISVRFKENGKSYYFDPAGADIKTGEYVIVETARGIECGSAQGPQAHYPHGRQRGYPPDAPEP